MGLGATVGALGAQARVPATGQACGHLGNSLVVSGAADCADRNFMQRPLSGASRSRSSRPAPPFRRWLNRLSRAAARAEQLLSGPLGGELLGPEALAERARAIAGAQQTGARPRRGTPLLERLDATRRVLIDAHARHRARAASGGEVGPAGEWLLDNFYVVLDHISEVRQNLPRGYYRELPSLAERLPRRLPARLRARHRPHLPHRGPARSGSHPTASPPRFRKSRRSTSASSGRSRPCSASALVESVRRMTLRTVQRLDPVRRSRRLGPRLHAAEPAGTEALAAEVTASPARIPPPPTSSSPGSTSGSARGLPHRRRLGRVMAGGRGPWTRGGGRPLQPSAWPSPRVTMANSITSLRTVGGWIGPRSSRPRAVWRRRCGAIRRGLRADDLRDARQLPARGGEARPAHPRRRADSGPPDRRPLGRRRAPTPPAATWAGSSSMRASPSWSTCYQARLPSPSAFAGPCAAIRPWRSAGHGRRDGVCLGSCSGWPGPTAPASLAGDAPPRRSSRRTSSPCRRFSSWSRSSCRHDAFPSSTSSRRRPFRPSCATAVVVPTLFAQRRRGRARAGEPRGAVPRQPRPEPQFVVLSDFTDAPTETLSGDAEIVAAAQAGVSELEARYGDGRADHLLPAPPDPPVEPRAGSVDGLGAQARKARRSSIDFVRGADGSAFAVTVGDLAQLARRPLRHHARRRHASPARRGAPPGRSAGAPAEPAASSTRRARRVVRRLRHPAAAGWRLARQRAPRRASPASSPETRASIRTPPPSRTCTRTSSARGASPGRASTTWRRSSAPPGIASPTTRCSATT